MATSTNGTGQSGMVKHDIEILTKVRIAVASMPGMTIGKFFDTAAEKELKKIKK